MASCQFLIRNRHQTVWYSRVIIPASLRTAFSGKRELRKSLGTPDKALAKRHSLDFWLDCQNGFDRLKENNNLNASFRNTDEFITWLSEHVHNQGEKSPMKDIDTTDALGRRHIIKLNGDTKAEAELAKQLHDDATVLILELKDNPEVLHDLLNLRDNHFPPTESPPETQTAVSEAIDLYIDKLNTQGRKGKKLAQRTLLNYQGRLEFWKVHFGQTPINEITLKELARIQTWITRLPVNFAKKGLSVQKAIEKAQNPEVKHKVISDKTRAEYLGQLKALLEYAFSSGMITADMAQHVEIPNTKQTKTVERLPFTSEDLAKMFPSENYGKEPAARKSGIDPAAKFWFPLIAAFTGARLEEIAQLKPSDIKTCPDTGIIFLDIVDQGIAGDGKKKSLKNKNSIRPIPIHPTLIKVGFLDFVDHRKADKKDGRLFKLKRDKQGRLARALSAWFSRNDRRKDGTIIKGYIEKCGIESKGVDEEGQQWLKSFHSFRHTAIDNIRGKKFEGGQFIRELDIALVMGHEKNKKETAKYGKDRSQLELRKAVIDALDYTTVDFSKLKWKS